VTEARNSPRVSLTGLQDELASLDTLHAELLADAARVDAMRELVRQALAVWTEEPLDAAQQSGGPSGVSESTGGSKSGGGEQPTTRELILEVLGTLPPGTQITTAALRTRLANEHDYRPRLDTLRRSAQRMANRGELIRVDHKTWATLPGPKAGDATS
jgi:hypothetical protein